MAKVTLGIAASLLAFCLTESSASAQIYHGHVHSHYGHSHIGLTTHYGSRVVPHYSTHLHAVPHYDHVDLVPHTTVHYHSVPLVSPVVVQRPALTVPSIGHSLRYGFPTHIYRHHRF
jgi:hypothetical protein